MGSRRKVTVASGAILCAALAAGAVAVAQGREVRFERVTPATGAAVADRTPTIRVAVANAGRLERFDLSVDGREVTGRVRRAGDDLVLDGLRLADGRHRVVVRGTASGMFGGDLDAQTTFVVDTRPPAVALSEEPARYSDSRTLVLRGSAEDGAALTATAGGREASATAAGGTFELRLDLPQGEHRVTVAARDAAGNRRTLARTVTVDTVSPRVALGVPRRIDSASPELAGEVTDRTDVEVEATLDDDPATLGARPAQPLAEGEHRLVVRAVDAAGNRTRETRRFLVDTTDELGSATLVRGARGGDVRELQRMLREAGYLHSRPTGVLAGGTLRAVRKMQAARSLPVDGVVGPMTIGALFGRIEIDQSAHTLTLFRPGQPTLSYNVAVGQAQYPTPNGTFSIISMVENPTWTPPDSDWAQGALPVPPGPDNPLGTRWMGISSPSVGIHGTPDPASIGYSVSHGCIRMRIPDAEALFEMVRIGTTVEIHA